MKDSKPISKKSSKLRYIRQNYQLYIFFMLPAFLLTIIFKYMPMGGLLLAFENYSAIGGLFNSPWIGLDNFRRFLSSPDFMNLLLNTLKLSVYSLLWSFPIPIILALLLSRVRRESLRRKIQLIVYAPNFISVIVVAGMLFLFLSPVGPFNKIIALLGGVTTNYMTSPAAFRTVYIASGIWQTAGWASIVYTACLANVNQELVDAAVIDGANIFQQIWNIEIQTIKPMIVIQFILAAGNIMGIGFEKALALQTPLNLPTSQIIPTYVYQLGLQLGDYGFSTAVGLFNSVINIILLIAVNQVVKHINDGEGI